jgi:hypothetical protein
MVANLPPQFLQLQHKLKTIKEVDEKIEILEELLAIVPKHKGTEKVQRELKSKLAKLRRILEAPSKGARQRDEFYIEKKGAAQAILIGFPNSGKSSLLAKLTNATPNISPYPYTTTHPMPGMLKYENIQLQLVDTPPLNQEALPGWLRHLIKLSEVIIIVVDLWSDDPGVDLQRIIKFLEAKRIFLKPYYRQEGLLKKELILVNKIDLPNSHEILALLKETLPPPLKIFPVSAKTGQGLAEIKKELYSLLEIIRVYSKPRGKPPDFTEPIVLKKGTTVLEMARIIHKDFAEKLNYAKITNQRDKKLLRVKGNYLLQEGDIVEFHI